MTKFIILNVVNYYTEYQHFIDFCAEVLIQQGVETAMYYLEGKGYYFERTDGYVPVNMVNDNNSFMFVFYGNRGDGSSIYYGENRIDAGVLFSIRTRGSMKNNDYSIYMDLGMGDKYRVSKMYHTHPRNNYLSEDDHFQGIIPTYAIGWDGVVRGSQPMLHGGLELPEIIIIAPPIKK